MFSLTQSACVFGQCFHWFSSAVHLASVFIDPVRLCIWPVFSLIQSDYHLANVFNDPGQHVHLPNVFIDSVGLSIWPVLSMIQSDCIWPAFPLIQISLCTEPVFLWSRSACAFGQCFIDQGQPVHLACVFHWSSLACAFGQCFSSI